MKILRFAVVPLLALMSMSFASTTQSKPPALVARMWHGKTQIAKADEYTPYLSEGVKKILAIKGNRGAQMMRSLDEKEGVAHFYVISYWDSREAIKAFAGDDITKTHNLPRDHEFLIDMEPNVKHFDVLMNEWAKP